MEGTEEKSADQVLSACFSGTNDYFGDPRVLPRVGDQYQAEIPSLDVEYDPIKHASTSMGAQFVFKGDNLMTSNTMFANGEDVKDLERLGEADGDDKMDARSLSEDPKTKMDLDVGVFYLADLSSEAWTNAECDSFLLGLYIFGKNLILVKRFVESKPMGDILRFYYGQFHGSERYRRWSGCRKSRKKGVSGNKIFTGWRHQELLSRLVSCISEDSQKLFIEVSRQMEEGRTPFEEYVFTVKDAVGLGNLVKAVGIGTGKRDLTRVVNESAKEKNMVPPPIPTGKSCSLLSAAEIIKLLTGDFRLSKARSRDLFWEAIWPRLLARGWHSEQPQHYGHSGSRHSLVFLIPGVKEFIKWRLVKGNHYFDSISDLLNKVKSEPELIELELGAVQENNLEEESWQDPSSKCDLDDMLDGKCHQSYLQPQNSKPSPASAGFVIVDTSSIRPGPDKMGDVRLLPSETAGASTHSGLNEKDASEVFGDKDDATDNRAGSNKSGGATRAIDDIQPILLMKCRSDLEMKAGHSDCEGSAPPQKDLSPLAYGETNSHVGNLSAQRGSNKTKFHFLLPVKNKSIDLQGGSSQDFSVARSFVGVSPDEHTSESCTATFPSLDKKYSHASINLNLQQVSTDTGTQEPLTQEAAQSHDQTRPAKSSYPSSEPDQQTDPSNPSYGASNIEQQCIRNTSRRSSRNRALTRKAMESMESGFFNTKRKRRDAEVS
ncbi:SANT domain-containing protein, partial [Psidium guajava]